ASPVSLLLSRRPPPASAFFPYTTLFRSTGSIVTVGSVSTTVTRRIAGIDTLPSISVTVTDTVAVPLASVLASAVGIVAVQLVPAAVTDTAELQALTQLVCRPLLGTADAR